MVVGNRTSSKINALSIGYYFIKKMRNVGAVFYERLTLKNQNAAVKKKAFAGLINVAKLSKLIDRESKLNSCIA